MRPFYRVIILMLGSAYIGLRGNGCSCYTPEGSYYEYSEHESVRRRKTCKHSRFSWVL